MLSGKRWWQSKTLWFEVVTGVAGVTAVLTTEGLIAPGALAVVVVVDRVAQAVLRFMTDRPLV